MSNDRSARLASGRIPALLLSFSAPAIVGMLAQAAYNLIDRVFVGHALGHNGIAGTTVTMPCMLILMGFGMLVGFGGGALVSIRLGEQRRDEAERVLAHVLMLLVAISAVLTVLGLVWLDPILRVCQASPVVLPYAHDYLQMIVLGTVFQVVGFGMNAIIRGEGNPKTAMFTLLIGVLLNAILAPLFIFTFQWGMRGAGLATVIAQAVSALWVISYFFSGRSLLRVRARYLKIDWPLTGKIMAIGSPPFAMQIAASVMNILLNHQLHRFGGDLAISVMGIIYTVVLMICMPIFGLNQGAQPIIGYNYGAQQFDRVKQALLTAILAATATTTVGFFLAMVFPAGLIRIFDPRDSALLELGQHAIRISTAMLPMVGFQIVSAGYFQAVGKPKHAMLLMLSRQVLILIPAVTILPSLFGLNGVWLAMPTSDLLSSLLTAAWLAFELRHLDRSHAQSREPQPAVPLLIQD
jgi:putative MATE family efflux protein